MKQICGIKIENFFNSCSKGVASHQPRVARFSSGAFLEGGVFFLSSSSSTRIGSSVIEPISKSMKVEGKEVVSMPGRNTASIPN